MLTIATKFILIALFFNRCSGYDINPQFVPRYHVYPPYGWMNDPNGFCKFENEYHLFYQYNPLSSQEPGIAHWAHVKSPDLIHWENLPIAMYPDQPYDKDGVFSGSAIIENGTMYLLYTGNVNFPGGNPDHQQVQALASSTDGVNVTKYEGNPVIKGEKFQPNIRDPKVWKHGNIFYMVLGNSFDNNTRGRALLYSSPDLISWKERSVLDSSDGSLGYMWECPDFFELDGKYVLLFSPQGIEPQGDKYRNLYQTGYIVGMFDYNSHMFTPITEFKELDHGHDFYATQTILDESGRRIVIAWLDMWERNYPERDFGSTGQMTIPRVLSLTSDLRLIQKPVKELANARGSQLYSGRARGGHTIKLDEPAADIHVRASRFRDFDLALVTDNTTVLLSYSYLRGTVTLDRGGDDGIRRTQWRPSWNKQLTWQILVDSSSVELFCGEGEITFSSRFFPYSNVSIKIGENSRAEELTVYRMRRTIKLPDGSN
nr:sucrose-6-phosphate hydrolase [Helicoverpa armigera]